MSIDRGSSARRAGQGEISKDARPEWRGRFDWILAVGFFLSSFLFGIVFTDLLGGVPIDQNLNYAGTPFGWIAPYGLISGLTMVSVFLLHGANFLTLKLDDKLRARAAARILYIFVVTMVVVPAISTYIYTDIGINPGILPTASVVVLLVTICFINRKMEGRVFVMLGLNIILTQIACFV